LKPKRVKEHIARALDHREASKNPTAVQPIHLWGPPGIGKSAIPKQVTEEREIGFVDMRLAQRDPTDLRGIPAVIDGRARWLPPPELPTDHWCLDCRKPLFENDLVVVAQGKKEGVQCASCKGSRITAKGILFLDELTSAPPLTQASAYQLTLDRQIGEYRLPDGWYVIAAGNRIEDRAVVYRMSTALANRFSHIDFEVNLDDWVDWAIGAKIDNNIVAFLNWRPELLFAFNPESNEKAFPTPRSWEFASNLVNFSTKTMLGEALEGTVGKGPTAEFMAFLKVQTELPDLNTILQGDNFVPKRMDLRYALVSALVIKAAAKQFERLLQYSEHLPAEFAVLLVMMMVGKDDKAVGACPSWDDWAKEHKDVLVRKRSG